MIDQNDSFILVMHAESIELLPPNTVLFIQDEETLMKYALKVIWRGVRLLYLEGKDRTIISKYYSVLYTRIFSSKHYLRIEY